MQTFKDTLTSEGKMDSIQAEDATQERLNNPTRKKVKYKDEDRTPDGGFKVKTYYPTMEQMKDFRAYIKYIHEDGGHRAGLAKVVPPSDYKPRKAGYADDSLYNMEISCPIRQEVTGEGGLYQQMNIVDRKKMSVKNFMRLSEEKHPTPLHSDETSLDRIFWKNVFLNPSIYGADVPGTLFDEDFDEFNLTRLNTILDDIQNDYGVTIQGVNTTYLYFGMWKSSFCWHTEDMDLYSINYLHTGAPKSWYCIAPEYGRRFERLAESFFPHSFKSCKAFLRHKTTLISPQVLKKYSVPFSRCTQESGQFMITFPYSYHSGYNNGFNIAEATNFATEHWIDFGKWATRCECSAESVKISMQTFVKRYQSDRYELWIRGRDVCKDPRDPKHVAPAPKPTEHDLYVMGIHDRLEEEATPEVQEDDERKKVALQQNLSSNLKSKGKSSKKDVKSFDETFQCYNDYLINQTDHNALNNSSALPHYSPIPTNMKPTTEFIPIRTCDNLTINLDQRDKPDYDQILKKDRSKTKKLEISNRKKEQRAKERIIASQELLQFLPITFTYEKRFNRLIATYEPHCSVCQLLKLHPRDDESIWNQAGDLEQSTSNILLPRSAFIGREWSGDQESEGLQEQTSFLESDINEPCDLLQCCICMLAVHRVCYGVDKMPQNKKDWICDRCAEPNRSTINCILCPCRGGALKSIEGEWVHITCALTLTQVRLNDLPSSRSTSAQLKSLEVSDKNSCVYCSSNMNLTKYVQGRCIKCSNCNNQFHPTCGHRNGALFRAYDYHVDPSLKKLLDASCGDCTKNLMNLRVRTLAANDTDPPNDPELEPLAIGSSVIAYSKNGAYYDGTVQSLVKKTTYDLFFPQANEINRHVAERNIIDLDKSRDYKVGDALRVKNSGGDFVVGKFLQKEYHDTEYVIKFDRSSQTEKVSRQNICLNVDQLPDEEVETYINNSTNRVKDDEFVT